MENNEIFIHKAFVVPAIEMHGDDEEDTRLLNDMLNAARAYLESFKWCHEIEKIYFGFGIGGIVAIFLFEIKNMAYPRDTFLWVVVGDLPPAYLVTDEAPDTPTALQLYIDLMREWVEAVKKGESVSELITVNAPTTKKYANMLQGRINYLEENVLPECREMLLSHPTVQ